LFKKDELSRQDTIRRAFSENFKFLHRGNIFYWVRQADVADSICGVVQRQRPRRQHEEPGAGGREIINPEWQGAMVYIDPVTHLDGQKIAFEVDETIGRPGAIINTLIEWVNKDPELPYHLVVKPIFNDAGFWDFARRHNYILRSVTFDLVVPNMWDTEGEFEEGMREAKEITQAQRVILKYESASGINTKSEQVRAGVGYSARGGGSMTALSLDRHRFASRKRPLTARVEDRLAPPSTEAHETLLKRIFGRA
jgi:hypothetical protein